MHIAPKQNKAKGLFVVGRFRSGSTAIWNIIRHIPGMTGYYEPCHDSLLEHIGLRTAADTSHVGVNEYWREYETILEQLPEYYRKEFATEQLCLSEKAEHTPLKAYIRFLLSSAPEGQAVFLKFNRMDLRLPWLRANFPSVPVLYIYRNPRDQWVSMMRNQGATDIDDPFLNTGYDLVIWSANLAPHVPLLGSAEIASSYERHYLIWRICHELSRIYATCTVSFDDEVQKNPEAGIRKVLDTLGADRGLTEKLLPLVVKKELGAWQNYHSEAWFAQIEARCDNYLLETGIIEKLRQKKLFDECAGNFAKSSFDIMQGLVYPLCRTISTCRSVSLGNIVRLNSSLGIAQAYNEQLQKEVEKLEVDSDREITQRGAIISEQKQFIFSLQEEIGKLEREATAQIAARDKALADKTVYTGSLEAELEKQRRAAETEIGARDNMLKEKDSYIVSLEKEVRRLSGSA